MVDTRPPPKPKKLPILLKVHHGTITARAIRRLQWRNGLRRSPKPGGA